MLTFQTLPARHVSEFAAAVREGLFKPGQRELPSKYLYDEVGSALFEAICLLPEYGLTRPDARLRICVPQAPARPPHPLLRQEVNSPGPRRPWTVPERERPRRWRASPYWHAARRPPR